MLFDNTFLWQWANFVRPLYFLIYIVMHMSSQSALPTALLLYPAVKGRVESLDFVNNLNAYRGEFYNKFLSNFHAVILI